MFGLRHTTVRSMLSDRPYLRHDYPLARTSALTWLLCAMAGGFLMQLMLGSSWFGSQLELENQFGLSIHGLRQGWIWTLVTHSFLHDTGFLFHVVGVGLLLYFIGGELLPLLGPRRFLGLYFGSIITGGLAWAATHWRLGGTHLGAMAAVDAMLVVFACFYPNRQMDFLLFFVLPVRVRPKHLVLCLLGIDLIGLVAYEILGAARPFEQLRLDHSAHLGGMLAGWVYYQFVHEARWRTPARAQSAEWSEQAKPVETPSGSSAAPRRDLRAEVNRVLDKINSHGFASLTPQEKRVLDEAKDSLSRR